MVLAALGWDAVGLEVGDLPDAGGEALIDPGIEEFALDVRSVVAAVDIDTRGDDGDGADNLDFLVADIELGDVEAVVAGPVELHGLGVDLTGPGDADVVV